MPSQAQRLISLFRTIVPAGVIAFLITSTALPMLAQSSVPATAVQAARTPQFASRLAHPAASRPNPRARQGSHSGPPQGGPIYDNGPINGTTDAWTINSGFVVSDTITVGNGSIANGMSFGAWLFPGDVIESVQISITSEPAGGTTYFNGVVNFTQSGCSDNQYGFNVCTETSASSFGSANLAAGTYWVNLANAVVNTGDPVYWDENSGVGCQSPGCPSQAEENSVGTIPSEAFTMQGNGEPVCFGSQGNLRILHDFTQEESGGPNGTEGVTIDQAGSLYGTTYSGGDNSAGFAYKLARFSGWLLDPLFSFFGGNNGGKPTGAILGPNGTLYGGAQGGIQNCGTNGSQYCGLVFNLTPQPTACLTSLCSWIENAPYRFSSETDGSGVINVSASDQEGNLYGTTSTGGAYGAGTVFELTPSGRSWMKTTLYSFTGGNDGTTPTQVLVGNDGNLYGVAGAGMFRDGVVFQLTPSGGQWTESVVHAFGSGEGSGPGSLVQDSAGNLYGIVSGLSEEFGTFGAIFVLEKTSSGWDFSENVVEHFCNGETGHGEQLNNLTIDAAGNLYGTGAGEQMEQMLSGSFGKKRPGLDQCVYSYIFKASYSNGWQYGDLVYLLDQYFPANGSLALDTSGNLYGTTSYCGAYGDGTVWQFSP